MHTAPVYLIIPSADIGGAEKRLVSIWLKMRQAQTPALKLVLPANLHDRLLKVTELEDLVQYEDDIILAPAVHSFFALVPFLIRLMRSAGPGAIFHTLHPYLPLLNRLYRQRIVYTLPTCHFFNFHLRDYLVYWMALLEAHQVDILDPEKHRQASKLVPWRRGKIHRTPGSFADPESFRPAPFEQRRNQAVFLGRFEPEKKVEALVEALPEVNDHLQSKGIDAPRFLILGHGRLKDKLLDMATRPSFRGVDMLLRFDPAPQKELARSKVFYSLQSVTNYPSRSLVEAMLSGCIPVVTDVRDTELLVPRDTGCYVPSPFSPRHIAEATLEIMRLPEERYTQRMNALRRQTLDRHTIQRSIDYFLDLYDRQTASV